MCMITDYDNWRTEWSFQVSRAPWRTIYLYCAKVNYYQRKVWTEKLIIGYGHDTLIPYLSPPWTREGLSNWHGTNGYAPIDFIKASIYDYTV